MEIELSTALNDDNGNMNTQFLEVRFPDRKINYLICTEADDRPAELIVENDSNDQGFVIRKNQNDELELLFNHGYCRFTYSQLMELAKDQL